MGPRDTTISLQHRVFKKIALSPPPIHTPNREIIYSTHKELLTNRDLPLEERRCQIFPGLNKALAYIGVLCNHGCIARFDDNNVITTKKSTNRVLMRGGR